MMQEAEELLPPLEAAGYAEADEHTRRFTPGVQRAHELGLWFRSRTERLRDGCRSSDRGRRRAAGERCLWLVAPEWDRALLRTRRFVRLDDAGFTTIDFDEAEQVELTRSLLADRERFVKHRREP